ncbi:MAG: alpha/beta hydrolase [Senegalia sp. (in: firmicutes)]|uniref:alpha/beta hydrolase n=1 Tax=Senegalia sp. (in: firmicutes) TaxID=1924098 RepID=UPI003F9C8C37
MKKISKKIILISIIVFLIAIVSGIVVYLNDSYEADKEALNILKNENIDFYEDEKIIVFKANKEKNLDKGFIFYPGGKVEYRSYAPLLNKLAEEGLTSVIVKMPFNLAVFDIDGALDVFSLVPEIENWYIGGHSLGGAMASSLIAENENNLQGLILLAAYPTEKIDKPIISIYGTNDKVLDKSMIDEDYEVIKIQGGNHAYFGNYDEQKGDGKSSISREEQQDIAVDAIIEFVKQ